MKTDSLASRHIGVNEEGIAVMPRRIDIGSLDKLVDKTIPANIRLKESLTPARPLAEYEFGKRVTDPISRNRLYTTYIGLGRYNMITLTVIQRNVLESPV